MAAPPPNPLVPPPPLTPSDVQGTQAEKAALGLAARLGWSWAQFLTRPAANIGGVNVCTPCSPPNQKPPPLTLGCPRAGDTIPVDSADGGGEIFLQPQEEAFHQAVDAGLLLALGEQAERAGAGWGGGGASRSRHGDAELGIPPTRGQGMSLLWWGRAARRRWGRQKSGCRRQSPWPCTPAWDAPPSRRRSGHPRSPAGARLPRDRATTKPQIMPPPPSTASRHPSR